MTALVRMLPAVDGWKVVTNNGEGACPTQAHSVLAWRIVVDVFDGTPHVLPVTFVPLTGVTAVVDPLGNRYPIGLEHLLNNNNNGGTQ